MWELFKVFFTKDPGKYYYVAYVPMWFKKK
jgi:hypothetical protein